LPHIYPLVNWSKPVVSLEQEFHKLIGDKYKGDHVISDKLLKFHLKAGGEQWILVHVEVESAAKPNVPERMFVYFYRIFDKEGKVVTALAIFAGDSLPKNYDRYEYELLKPCSLTVLPEEMEQKFEDKIIKTYKVRDKNMDTAINSRFQEEN